MDIFLTVMLSIIGGLFGLLLIAIVVTFIYNEATAEKIRQERIGWLCEHKAKEPFITAQKEGEEK